MVVSRATHTSRVDPALVGGLVGSATVSCLHSNLCWVEGCGVPTLGELWAGVRSPHSNRTDVLRLSILSERSVNPGAESVVTSFTV